MPDEKEIASVLERTRTYLTKTLLPFWLERSVDQEMAQRMYAAVAKNMVDTRYGGFYELMQPDWQPERPGKYGGVLVEGPMDAPTPITEKQFWQQAEVLVGLLDAYTLFGDEKYWKAFMNVYNFVFDKFFNMAGGGEWYERVDRLGNPIDAALGHAWKINYHTVRSMVQTIERLKRLVG